MGAGETGPLFYNSTYKKLNSNGLRSNYRPKTIKLLEETYNKVSFDTSSSMIFGLSSGKGNKSKNKQMVLHQALESFLVQ